MKQALLIVTLMFLFQSSYAFFGKSNCEKSLAMTKVLCRNKVNEFRSWKDTDENVAKSINSCIIKKMSLRLALGKAELVKIALLTVANEEPEASNEVDAVNTAVCVSKFED